MLEEILEAVQDSDKEYNDSDDAYYYVVYLEEDQKKALVNMILKLLEKN